tara:strand:- start:200 stop:1300 length:1101 start_codon:yes stop_codon:yes gene_type:complete
MKNNIIQLKSKKRRTSHPLDLSRYKQRVMYCPVTKKKKTCFAIPLDEINPALHNPARINGTPATYKKIYEDLITNPDGQLEPICVKWDSYNGEFALSYGYTRKWAMEHAKKLQHQVAGSLEWCLWAWIFNGSEADEIEIQMMENGNKIPNTPASDSDMKSMLAKFIKVGGLDTPSKLFKNCDDIEQYEKAKKWMKSKCPAWGGRKFKGLWNEYTKTDPNSVASFKNWHKIDQLKYFIAHNKEGITQTNGKILFDDSHASGKILKVNGKSICLYFSTQGNAYNSSALLVNICRKKMKEKIDLVIVIQSINGSNSTKIDEKRKTMKQELADWNEKIFPTVDKVYWLPQTKTETDDKILIGEFLDIDIF